MPTLYVAVTNHGFGHATRAASIAAEIRLRCQQAGIPLTLILATTAPKWLLDSYLKGDYIHRKVSFDVGVLQSDSLTMNKVATLAALQAIQEKQSELIAEEAAFLNSAGVDLVLADIPPLMAKIAHAAAVPCWMMGNFGWDFIYRPWGDEFAAIADWIADCFSDCDRLFRLPFHEPMTAFPCITDVGLTGGIPKLTASSVRERFGITTPKERTILLTFGGLGLAKIPYEQALQTYPDWQFITFDRQAPALPNLLKITERWLRPADLMVVCDRIVSKPGYSTFAEACRQGVGVATLPRQGFAEAPLLLEGIQRHARHQILDSDAFFDGDWSFLDQSLVLPTANKLAQDGNEIIANAISAYLSARGA